MESRAALPMTRPRVLLVEDEEIIALVIQDNLIDAGFDVVLAGDGQEAWERLVAGDHAFETILLDWEMPRLDGMQLLRQIKAMPELMDIPVIMETAVTDPASIQEGLNAGAHYYLTKPFDPKVLISVVRAATAQFREHRQMLDRVRLAHRPFEHLESGIFRFRSIEDGCLLADFLAAVCPEPETAILGLRELLINAVEHGNLGISYAEKSHLLFNDTWHEEIDRRMNLDENRDKRVRLHFERRPTQMVITITDEGQGFEWRDYLDFDPKRAFDLNGRGIALARVKSFDTLEYQGNGNSVVATIRLPSP